jgi:hypothetical protein
MGANPKVLPFEAFGGRMPSADGLGVTLTCSPPSPRSRGVRSMHWRTYHRLRARGLAADEQTVALIDQHMKAADG